MGLAPVSVVLMLLSQSPLGLGGILTFPVDAGEAVPWPASASVIAQHGEPLVAWSDPRRDRAAGVLDAAARNDVWAARVPGQGGLPPAFLVCAAPRGATYLDPQLAGDGGEVLVVWREEAAAGVSLRATVLQADGGTPGTCGRVLAGPLPTGGVGAHRLAFGPEGYLLTWEEPSMLKGRLVDAADLAAGQPVMTLGDTFYFGNRPRLSESAVVGTSTGYLVTWLRGDAAPYTIYANLVRDGGPAYAPDASIVFSGAKSMALVGRGAQNPLLLYTWSLPGLFALEVDPETATAVATGSSPWPKPVGGASGPLRATSLGSGVLVAYYDEQQRRVASERWPADAGVPAPLGLSGEGALAEVAGGAVVLGQGATGDLALQRWSNGGPQAPVAVGGAPASQRSPSVAWAGDRWVLAWETARAEPLAEVRLAVAVLDASARPGSLHGLQTARRFLGLAAQPAGFGLRALTAGVLGNSAVTALRWPPNGAGDFLVDAPTIEDTVDGVPFAWATGEVASVLFFQPLVGSEVARILPYRVEQFAQDGFGRCAASAAGKVWFPSRLPSGVRLLGAPDQAVTPQEFPVLDVPTMGRPTGRPCVAASGPRLLVAVETTSGLETVDLDLDTGVVGPQALLAPQPSTRLGAPVVAAAPGGFVIVSEAEQLAGVRVATRHLVGHARTLEGVVSGPTWVGDLRASDEGAARLSASGGKLLLAWERVGDAPAVVARSVALVLPPVDAGAPDAGGDDAGGAADAGEPADGGDVADAGTDGAPVEFSTCGCAADGGLALGLWVAALAWSRRRR